MVDTGKFNNRWVVCIIEIRGKEGVIWLTQANSRSQEVDLLAPGRLSSISKWGGHLRIPNFD